MEQSPSRLSIPACYIIGDSWDGSCQEKPVGGLRGSRSRRQFWVEQTTKIAVTSAVIVPTCSVWTGLKHMRGMEHIDTQAHVATVTVVRRAAQSANRSTKQARSIRASSTTGSATETASPARRGRVSRVGQRPLLRRQASGACLPSETACLPLDTTIAPQRCLGSTWLRTWSAHPADRSPVCTGTISAIAGSG